MHTAKSIHFKTPQKRLTFPGKSGTCYTDAALHNVCQDVLPLIFVLSFVIFSRTNNLNFQNQINQSFTISCFGFFGVLL